MARKKVILESEVIDKVKPEVVEEVKPKAKEDSKYYPASKYAGYELTVALREMGVDSSYGHRMEIYKANGFENYLGLGAQNKQMLDLLKAGKLIKA